MNRLDLSLEETQKKILKKILIPVFHDTHMHFIEYGKFLSQIDLRNTKSIVDLIHLLALEKDKEKIEAFGWNQTNFSEKRDPNRYDLDQIACDRPILLSRICGHVTVVNSYVIEALGLDEQIPVIIGGSIDIDELGKPTGIFREKARNLLKDKGYYDTSLKDVENYILTAQEDLLKKGITVVHSDDLATFPNLSADAIIGVFEELIKQNKLVIKVIEQANVDSAYEIVNAYERLKGKQFEIGSIKRFTDGSLGARTAHLREAYSDEPGQLGIQIQSDEQLKQEMVDALSLNIPLSIHAIGDKAIERVLSNFEALKAPLDYYEKSGIIHCQITSPDLLKRIKKLGIRVYIQPIFLHEDAKIVYDRVGEQRASESYVWKTMFEMGIPLYMSSDAPIDTPDVIKGLYCLTTRKTLDENPIIYLDKEALDLEDALVCYCGFTEQQEDWILLDSPLEDCLRMPNQNHIVNVWLNNQWLW
jgi:predicted amidohydrolase YtcJ